MAWIIPRFVSKKWILLLSLLLLLSPLFYVWLYGEYYGAIFWRIEANVEDSEELSGNTRTLLYQEVTEDIQKRDRFTQWLGQGTLAHYDSPSFKNEYRLVVEVPVLQWIMQCGILFYVLLTILCAAAVIYIYIYGQNRLMETVSILLGAFFFMCHVSNFMGCNTMHLGFWGMLGMAFNPIFLDSSDDIVMQELS